MMCGGRLNAGMRAILLILLCQQQMHTASSFLIQSPATGATQLSPAPLLPQRLHQHHSTRLFAKSGKKKKKPKTNTICLNRAARRNYEILETFEAGISLKGTEVKAIRDGKMTIVDGWIKPNKNGRSCTLMNVHIGRHAMSGEYFQHEERRERPLLLHRSEARKLLQKTDATGLTVVPLKAYFNDDNFIKLEIALVRGKNVRDKRADIKAKEAKRDMNRIMKNFRI
mmetsp:Transcript_16832/g.46484  ORF Transcript_16832/g.46484 Transcript_16832/m.46484 type:complete len:226 (-) Transcript_16832:842-1519(-)